MILAGVSVIICAYNSAERLPATLEHLADQELRPDIPWEVLVVDNASTDDTSEVAEAVWQECGNSAPFTIVQEPKPGLSFAREAGFAKARYNYLLLCDDDNWLNPNYITTAFDIMQQSPAIGVLGGKGELVFESEPPAWIKLFGLYANGPQAPASGLVTSNYVYGAGSVLRKSAFDTILAKGFYSMLTDRNGAQLTSGGDLELCYALAMANYQIWYDERLTFKHFTPDFRLGWDYYLRYIKESATCFAVLEPYKFIVNHGTDNLFSFRIRMMQSFLYHVKILLPLAYQRAISNPESDEGKAYTLRYRTLLTRLASYVDYQDMQHNFLKIKELKRQLQALQ